MIGVELERILGIRLVLKLMKSCNHFLMISMGLVISAKKDQIFPFLLIAPKDIKAHLTITERANYDGGAIDLS